MNSNYDLDEYYERTYNNRLGFYKKEIELGFIKSFLNQDISLILDIGGGSGRMALPLQKLGFDVNIIDINENSVKLALHRGIKAECTDFMDYKNNKKFDLILSIESLDYISDKQAFFGKCNNLLDAEGMLIFTIPNIGSWRYILRSLRKNKTDYFHSSFEKYKNILNDIDFEIIKTKGFLWMPLKVNSNSRLVTLFKLLEKILGLNYFIAQSPWLIIACRKRNNK